MKKCERCGVNFIPDKYNPKQKRCGSIKNKIGCTYLFQKERMCEYNKKYRKTDEYKIYNRKKIKEYYKNNPIKYKVRHKVFAALKNGTLKKPLKCEKCNKKLFLEGHHPDYSKPLKVIWLCKKCHIETDRLNITYIKK